MGKCDILTEKRKKEETDTSDMAAGEKDGKRYYLKLDLPKFYYRADDFVTTILRRKAKMTGIKYENGKARYFDKNGKEIFDGDTIRYNDGEEKKVYLTESETLGTDATNPAWIKSGRAVPCEFGIYPLTEDEMKEIEKV